MLVLSRRLNESILIDGHIEVVVLSTDGESVKLGIKAPKEVNILRKELYEAIQQSNQEASRATAPLSELARLLKKDQEGNN